MYGNEKGLGYEHTTRTNAQSSKSFSVGFQHGLAHRAHPVFTTFLIQSRPLWDVIISFQKHS